MDLTSTWCSGGEKAEVIEALGTIGCCDLCILRYLGVKEPYIYRDKTAVAKILGKGDVTSGDEGGDEKKVKVNPCTACLGLLQTGTRHVSLDRVVAEIRESKIESMSFCPVLSVPISILIRAYSIWFYLIKKFPSVYVPIKEYKPESISLKSVWKWISTKYLQSEVNPLSDWSNDGKLTIQIFPSYVDEERECQPLHDHFTQGGKVRLKKGRVAVSRGSVEVYLGPLDSEEFSAKFQCPPDIPTHSITIDRIVCSHAPIFVAGRYCKFSRVLSQTPWVIDGVKKTPDSVEELISAQLLPVLGADEARFSSSGREDVDVRTLGKGRPFVFEVINPRRTIFTRERMMELQKAINESTTLISVRDIQIVDKKDLTILKEGEESKTKNYCALCIAPGHPVTEEDCEKINNIQLPLVLMQKTPVRVMHRRSLAVRERSIFEIKAIPVTSPKHNQSLFKLYVKTQAGTYVKEFVHGDLGRTTPNVSDLLGFSADIIALDVESVDVDWPPEIYDDQSSTPVLSPLRTQPPLHYFFITMINVGELFADELSFVYLIHNCVICKCQILYHNFFIGISSRFQDERKDEGAGTFRLVSRFVLLWSSGGCCCSNEYRLGERVDENRYCFGEFQKLLFPGVPMEIVLNKESKRKTPVAISFRDGERLIGEDALNVAVRFPQNAYMYFLDLLGKRIDNPIVKQFQKRFPYYKIVADEERGTVLFQHDSETFYSPEELLGMLISKSRDYAQDFARQPVREAVLTVPPYFNQAERRAVLIAAELAGVKVLQLMNTNTAAALNYGIFRRKDFNESAQNILLYDMGATSTVATIVSYQVVKAKDRGIVETNPQLSILGVGYDRTLGGLEIQLRLRNYLAKAFNDMKKTPTDITSNHRAMAKLFKEAGRVKQVLSANTDHYAQVENLLEEKDYRVQVSREQLEKLNEDLFDRVCKPVEDALNAAGLTIDVIDQVILVGAGTRVPKVQETLINNYKRELGKSLNTDEAAAMGAVYKAADLSTGFKVKKFLTKDAVIFPIWVDFEREIENEGSNTKTIKIIRRTLFAPMNPYPQKKILTFNKHVSDFTFYVSYGDLPVSANEALAVGSSNITKVELSGVAAAIEKNKAEGVDCKGVKAHFAMDDSGVFALSHVEIVFEKNTTEPDAGSEDTLSKLGSAFSSLFSGSSESEPGTPKPDEDQANADEQKADAEPSETGNTNTTDGQKQNETVNQAEGDAAKQNATETPKKPKVVTIKETLDLKSFTLDVTPLDGSKLVASTAKLNALNEADKKRALMERSRNTLEAFVLDMSDKIYSSAYENYVSEDEREKIGKACSEISDWLYEDGSNAEKDVYDEKFKSLKLMTKDVEDRVREHKDRPDALDALDKMINISQGFLESSKNVPEDQQYFTEVEVTTLDKLLTETLEWRDKKLKEQEKTPLTQAPALTVRMIAEKLDALDREVKYMVNKARVNKLKKQREEETKAKEASESGSSGEESPKDKDNTVPDSTGESGADTQPKEAKDEVKDQSKGNDGQTDAEKFILNRRNVGVQYWILFWYRNIDNYFTPFLE
ncbi:unnamed protein product [Allacma fusca]|uniref:Hypoxia up-regulated protein 1 n=1 Tax=Allacma fusca TaxID=39272 RepID=A0A8J2LPE5_9HEXA|nr:unnamed protein product [Allacma fusca]